MMENPKWPAERSLLEQEVAKHEMSHEPHQWVRAMRVLAFKGGDDAIPSPIVVGQSFYDVLRDYHAQGNIAPAIDSKDDLMFRGIPIKVRA